MPDPVVTINTTSDAPAPPVSSTPAPGIQSSEFVASIVGVICMVLSLFSSHPPSPELVSALVAAIVGVYTAARTLLKAVHTLGYLKSIPDLPEPPANSITITPQKDAP